MKRLANVPSHSLRGVERGKAEKVEAGEDLGKYLQIKRWNLTVTSSITYCLAYAVGGK